MSRFWRLLLAAVISLAVAGSTALAPEAAVAKRHTHADHHKHKKKHYGHKHKKHHKKRRAAAPAKTTACPNFPANNWWNRDISRMPVHRYNSQWLSHMSTSRRLHPDFGGPYGIPVTTVRPSHAKVSVAFDYVGESDRVGYPLGPDTRIEGGRNSGGDMHAIVVDRSACRLWETWDTTETSNRWRAGSGATWSLRSNALRPETWTSADAAGLPIFPGLLRYDEVRAGRVTHAVRFTTNVTSRHYLWPAKHQAGSQSSISYPPMGARFRLKSSYNISGYDPMTRVVLTGMKRYGLVLADNGSPWFFQGAQDSRWPDALIEDLKRVPASAFEAVDTSSWMIARNSAATR